MQVRLMRLMPKMEYGIVPKGTEFTGRVKYYTRNQKLACFVLYLKLSTPF